MNLCLLLFVNQSLFYPTSRKKLLLAAGIGAAAYLVSFFCSGSVYLKVPFSMLTGTVFMILTGFRIQNFRGFLRILEKMLMYSFFMGGILLCIIRFFPNFRKYLTGTFGILGLGIVVYLVVSFCKEKKQKEEGFCKVTLKRQGGEITIVAFLDSGNSLLEPISGKPVSIIEEEVFQSLWKEETPPFRVIPYHSIGRKRGILKGYLLPEILIETDGLIKSCKDIYVAVSSEKISGESQIEFDRENTDSYSVRMLLHPELLQEK